ncbi:MAG: sigma-70 family RNA polymerase sigma factor [Acidobacteria bacterium]|nr:sigma-70 family RNA polymerase sigma factor [Acidobacteriota bacterium]
MDISPVSVGGRTLRSQLHPPAHQSPLSHCTRLQRTPCHAVEPRYSQIVASFESEPIESIEKAFARGDDDALRVAYKHHGSLVYTFCHRTLDESRAKDVTQEVFISAWKSRGRYEPAKGSLAGWLIAIARNRIIDNVRAEQRYSDRRAGGVAPDDVHVGSQVDRIADRLLIAEALRCLSDRARQVVTMHYFEDLTLRQIAEATQQPLGTVKSDLRRGLERIRHQLESDHG